MKIFERGPTLAIALILIFSVFISACSPLPKGTKQYDQVPLFDFSNPVVLRVARVINPRFKSLTDDQIDKTLKKASQLITSELGVEVKFKLEKSLAIEEFFKLRSAQLIREKSVDIIPFKNGLNPKDKERMVESIERSIRKLSPSVERVYQYARPYLKEDIQTLTFRSLSVALTDTMLWRLSSWRELKAADGQAIINNRDDYNEWVWWDTIGYASFPYDLIITNQLVASIEAYGMDAHSALRGGITNGTTTFSQGGQFKTYAFSSSFPMINDYDVLNELRNDGSPTMDERVDYLAAIVAHEIGHLLFHYGHPYDAKACIMSPAPLLDFKSWIQGFDKKACFSGNHKAMKKGAVELHFEPHLVIN